MRTIVAVSLIMPILALSTLQPAYAKNALKPAPCDLEGTIKSENSRSATSVTFVNQTDVAVRTYWLNFNGHRVYYRDIPAGESYTQQTFVTHPWVITNSDPEQGAGHCIGLFLPTTSPSAAIVR